MDANRQLRAKRKAKHAEADKAKQAQVQVLKQLRHEERELSRNLARALAKADESCRENNVLRQKLQLLDRKLMLTALEDEHGQLEQQLVKLTSEHESLLNVRQIQTSAAELSARPIVATSTSSLRSPRA